MTLSRSVRFGSVRFGWRPRTLRARPAHAAAERRASPPSRARTMPPKRSAHVLTSDDAPDAARAAAYNIYYCKFCGDHCLTTEASLAAAPRRRTDAARVIDTGKHVTKLKLPVSPKPVAVKRENGEVEVQYRFACGTVPVGYYATSTPAPGALMYIFDGALSAFDYEKDHAVADDGSGVRPPPPCVIAVAGGATQVDIEVDRDVKGGRGVTKISASAIKIVVKSPLTKCDAELLEFLAVCLDLKLTQMSLLRGRTQTTRTLLVKGRTPAECYAALTRSLEHENARVAKLANLGQHTS